MVKSFWDKVEYENIETNTQLIKKKVDQIEVFSSNCLY
jgi:hypothetical protein